VSKWWGTSVGVKGAAGGFVKLWERVGGCRNDGWGLRGEIDSPLPATTSRGLGNIRDQF